MTESSSTSRVPVLRVLGEVASPTEFTRAGLTVLPEQVPDVGAIAPGRQGAAVPLSVLLERVRPAPSARYATLRSSEGSFAASVSLEALRDAVVVYALGGGELPRALGGPFRFLIPASSECRTAAIDDCANVKYLASIELSATPGADTRPTTATAHAALHR